MSRPAPRMAFSTEYPAFSPAATAWMLSLNCLDAVLELPQEFPFFLLGQIRDAVPHIEDPCGDQDKSRAERIVKDIRRQQDQADGFPGRQYVFRLPDILPPGVSPGSGSQEFLPVPDLPDLHKASFNFFMLHPLLSEFIQCLCYDPAVLISCDFLDPQDPPALVPEPSQMDDNVQRRCDLPLDRRKGQVDSHHHHGFQPVQHIRRIVRVAGGHGAAVPVQHGGGDHIHRLLPADLSHDLYGVASTLVTP